MRAKIITDEIKKEKSEYWKLNDFYKFKIHANP